MYIEIIANTLDILISSIIIYLIYYFSKGTYTGTIVKGMLLAISLYLGAKIFNLKTISWIFESFFGDLTLILVILFHQEIRRFLSNIGRNFYTEKAHKEFILMLVQNLLTLSKQEVGALIVIERSIKLDEFIKTGVILNAQYSAELIETIFNKNSSLHDGAVIIRKERIMAAHVFFPSIVTSNNQINGTRHAAALSISNERDCIAFIVSEETGSISYALKGVLTSIPNPYVEEVLREILA
ncbi:MAG: diadenylate cyclase CdaA [Brevinema sp.]